MAHEHVDKEMYDAQFRKFLVRCKGLDDALILFFSQVFSKEPFVTPNFFTLIEKMKALNGTHVQSVLQDKNDSVLTSIVQKLCQGNKAEYVLNSDVVSCNKAMQDRTAFCDPDRKISFLDLRRMNDLSALSFINAFDLPYLPYLTDLETGKIGRSSFEHFMSAFIGVLVPEEETDDTEILRFNLLKNASGHIGYTVTSWVQILYLITHILQNIYRLAFEAMQEKIPDYHPMIEKMSFINQFVEARKKVVDKQKMPESAEAFKDFLRIDFLRITTGSSKDTSEKQPIELLEFMMSHLNAFIESAKAPAKIALDFFKAYRLKENLSGACKEFCDISIRFQIAFDHLLTSITDKEDSYQLTLHSGIQLLKVLYPGSFPDVPPDAKSASNTPTPRSRRGTPRDQFGGSPRSALSRSSASPPPSVHATPGMWKRTSAGGDMLSGGLASSSPSLNRAAGGDPVK